MPIRKPNHKDIQKTYALMDSINIRQDGIMVIGAIVYEEVSAFFEGQKSAEDVASIIQNRASIFLAELD